MVVFSSVLENSDTVVKISSLPEISIADLLRAAWKGLYDRRRPGGVAGGWVGRCASVTAPRMTDAYGASTPQGVLLPPLITMRSMATVPLKRVTPDL